MTLRQQIMAISISLVILGVIINLVKKRKLREEFSLIWLVTGVGLFILAIWYKLLEYITNLIGAVLPTSTLFFFGIIFLMCVCLHFSVKISDLTNKVKDLAQRMAILDLYINELQDNREGKEGEKY